MNYELAKQLKEAGFPMERIDPTQASYYQKRDVFTFEDKDWKTKAYLIPTLSELIEACGEIPLQFDNVHNGNGPRMHLFQWRAKTDNRLAPQAFPDSPNEYYGATLEEAVAKLWLALNDKGDTTSSPL